VQLVPGAADAIARLRSLGYAIVVVSNQSGVARGMFDEDAVHAVNARMDELLRAENAGAVIDRHEFCPFHPEAAVEHYRQDSDLRKPKPGMLFSAAKALALDLHRSWLIGDAPRDVDAGNAAGVRTILFHDLTLPASEAANGALTAYAEFVVSSLGEAAAYIADRPTPPQDEPQDDGDPGDGADVPDEEIVPAAVAPEVKLAEPAPLPPPPPQLIRPRRASMFEKLIQPMVPTDNPVPDAPPPAPRPAHTPPPQPIHVTVDTARLEKLVTQLSEELRRHREQPPGEFSVPKLLAGITQMLAIAALLFAYFAWATERAFPILLVALLFQTMTVALLIMGRQR
jgi:histidinol-phosphate phosphatase family protein